MKRLIQVIVLMVSFLRVGAQEHDIDFTFVNFVSKSPDKIYLGAIMDIGSLNSDTHPIIEIPNRQMVQVLQEGPITDVQMVPNRMNMINFILDDIKDEDFSSYVNSFTHSIDAYPSYERLGSIFGEKIDAEILLGVTRNPAKNRSITIVKLSRLLNRLLFEVKDDKIKDNPAIAALDLKDLMYVQDIWFGRMATIVVESGSDSKSIKAILEKILGSGQKLSEQEEAIMANSTIHYSVFNDPQADLGGGDTFENVKQYMKAILTKDDFLRPIYFSGQSLSDGSMVGNLVK